MRKQRFRFNRAALFVAFFISVAFCAMASEGSTSPTGITPDYTPAAGAKITFSEFPVGTHISTQYADLGIYFGGDDPYIETDVISNPTSPVLSGTPIFTGAIEGRFIVPQSPDPNICDPKFDRGGVVVFADQRKAIIASGTVF